MKHTRASHGYTLTEILVASLVVLLVVGGAVAYFTWPWIIAGRVERHAEEQAVEYARRMHPRWRTVLTECQRVDEDGNGYVRCTLGDGNVTEQVECAAYGFWSLNRGCQQPRGVLNTGR
jgi:hypothetical protein